MVIGHYGVALALKRAEKTISLGLLFLASVFVDLLWGIFVLLGIETVRIVPGITAANPLDFVSYPFTHSLVASVLWAGAVYGVCRVIPAPSGSQQKRVALVMGGAVLSHFFLDALVHRPDLPLVGNESYKVGFGLYNHVLASYVVEGFIFLGGLWIYLHSTRGTTVGGKYGMSIFAVFLLIANLSAYREDMLKVFVPFSLTPEVLAAFLVGYNVVFAGIAFWVDRKRH